MFVPADGMARAPSPRERIEAQFALLERLAAIGMGFAEAAEHRRMAAFGDPQQAEAERAAGVDFDRAARSVRLTIALQARLTKELPEIEKAEKTRAIWRASDAKASILHRVERAIRADHDDEDAIEALVEDARERMENDYEAEDLLRRPVAQIVARICRDLGLSPQATVAALDPFTETDEPEGAGGDAEDDPGPLPVLEALCPATPPTPNPSG